MNDYGKLTVTNTMKRFLFSMIAVATTFALLGCSDSITETKHTSIDSRRPPLPSQFLPQVPSFEVSSSDVVDGQQMALDQAHESAGGKSMSPSLAWTEAPEGTKSYAVTCFDPDAPTGSGFWHWVVLNIPADVNSLTANSGVEGDDSLPEDALQLRNDFGKKAFGGAAPPKGDGAHRYVFTIHALDVDTLNLPADSSPAMAGFMISQHTLARAEIVPTYTR